MTELFYSGKVRDLYTDGKDLLLVGTDRVSVYDVVLPTLIPDKGKILTALSLWWFEQTKDIVPNHVISARDVPDELAGRAIRCRRLEMLEVECIARGYLAGLGLKEYEEQGSISGVPIPPEYVAADKLPEPIFTPTTKAPLGEHDAPMTHAELGDLVGPERAAELGAHTLAIYNHATTILSGRGLLVADTKLEFGVTTDGTLTLGDEVLTPDSSRFWRGDDWMPGLTPSPYDKQYLRDWSSKLDWNRTAPGPEIPPHVVTETQERYMAVYEMITGQVWQAS